MEVVLLGITGVSLIVAFIMSTAAWRLSRHERARSRARVAALVAAANEPETTARAAPKATPAVEPASEPVAVGESRPAVPWTSARVSTFAVPARSTIGADSQGRLETTRGSGTVSRPADLLFHAAEELPSISTSLGEGFLGSVVEQSPSNGRQRALAVAAIFLFVAVISGGYWTVYGDRSSGAGVSAGVSNPSPLELISLRHERRGGRLSVTGLVRNPGTGTAVEKLTAVIFLFDQHGGFITSARADVDFVKLAPGDESPFVVALDAPANVARYRVSFRTDGGVVPHIDRRGQEPIAPDPVSHNATAMR